VAQPRAYTARVIAAWRKLVMNLRRVMEVVLLFAMARLLVGVALITVFDRSAVAWGHEASVIALASVGVYLCVGVAVRRAAR
jgi:hypothetical protein